MRLPLRAPALLRAALALPCAVLAAEPFEALRARAEPITDLAPFVERYVGRCASAADRPGCERARAAARRTVDGRLFLVVLTERLGDLLRVERRGGRELVQLTPFVDAGGLGLTDGEPRPGPGGRHAVRLLTLTVAPGAAEGLAAALRTGRAELEILFRPEGAWSLARRGEAGADEGMRARFAAVRLVDGRTGAELAALVR